MVSSTLQRLGFPVPGFKGADRLEIESAPLAFYFSFFFKSSSSAFVLDSSCSTWARDAPSLDITIKRPLGSIIT